MELRFFFTYLSTISQIDEPVGWDDVRLSIKRDFVHYGAVFEFSSELSFYGDARDTIALVYQTQNIDGVVTLKVEYYDPQDFTWKYFYEGVLVLKDLQLSRVYAKCRIEQTDFNRAFRNKRDLDVALEANKTVKLHSRVIRQQAKWAYDAGFNSIVKEPNIGLGGKTNAYIAPLVQTSSELDGTVPISAYWANNIGGSTNPVNYPQELPAYYIQFAYTGQASLSYDFKGEFQMLADAAGCNYGFSLVYFVGDSYDFSGSTVLRLNPSGGGLQSLPANVVVVRPFDWSGSVVLNVLAGQKLWFFFRMIHNYPPATAHISDGLVMRVGSYLTLFVDTKGKASDCEGVDIFEAFNQIVENYTGLPNRFRSDFFSTGCGQNLLLTNGYKLRRLNEKAVFCSFDRLYSDLRAIFNLGLSVVNEGGIDVVRVEDMAYFFDNTPVFEIDSPSDKTISPYMDLYFNKISVGYKKWSNEQLNGLDEFNSERQYGLSIKLGQYQDGEKNRIELNLMCELVTAGYLIEQARRLFGLPTTDNGAYDNDLFLVALNRQVVFTNIYTDGASWGNYAVGTVSERDEMYFDVENIISRETVYNVRLSPLQNLSRWIPYLHAQLCKNFANLKIIQFRSGTGNVNLRTSALSTILPCTPLYFEDKNLSASLDVLVNNQALFDAETVELDYPLSFSAFLTVKNALYSVVKVDGIDYYMLHIDYSPSRALATFKLLKRYV